MVLCLLFKNEFQGCYLQVDLSSSGPIYYDCELPSLHSAAHYYQEVKEIGGLGLEGFAVSS